LLINTLSIEADWDDYLNILRLDGTMVVVGNSGKKSLVSLSTLIRGHRSLRWLLNSPYGIDNRRSAIITLSSI